MDEKMREYINKKLIGNIRSGTRGEKDKPVKLAYFNVHTDKSTPELAVEIFNEIYNKPNKLKIRFFNQNPLVEGLQRYEGKKLKCYGNGREARTLDNDGKRQGIECKGDNCQYRKDRKCKRVGRLYFIIDKLEDEGIWCYPMGSEKGIENVKRRIERANRLGQDLTKDWYELYLKAEDAIIGKNYIPDIKKLEAVENTNISNGEQNNKNNNSSKTNKTNKNVTYLKIVEFKKAVYEDKEVSKIICMDTSLKKHELILMPESNQDILKVKAESIIMPISVSTRNNFTILNDYKIVKAIVENNTENKKAV